MSVLWGSLCITKVAVIIWGGGMHHNMDHGSTGMGLQESIGNGITTNLVWEGEKLLQG